MTESEKAEISRDVLYVAARPADPQDFQESRSRKAGFLLLETPEINRNT